jgi:cell division protein YceG involved in septum cleavage
MEKLKDFIYDISDMILAALIVIAIVVVVATKVSTTMDMSFMKSSKAENASKSAQAAKPSGDTSPGYNIPVSFEISSGATGYSIAKQLREQGLISDSSAFIKRVEEMNAGSKLKAGTFILRKSMTLDEIIKSLAGIN